MQGGVIVFPTATPMSEELLIYTAKGFELRANNNITFTFKLILQLNILEL